QQQHENRRGEAQRNNRSTTGQAPTNAQPNQRGQAERNQNRSTTGQAPSSAQPSTQRSTQQPSTNQPSSAQQPSNQRQGQTTAPAQTQTQTGAATQGTSTTFRSASGRVTLDPQRQNTLRTSVLTARNAPRVNSVNFAVNVGVVVPSHVHVATIS